MKTPLTKQRTGGFTRWDLLAVIVTAALTALIMIIPAFTKARATVSTVSCVDRLKQVGMAARMWANDGGEGFAWAHSTNFGGSLEHVGTADPLPHFQAHEKELPSPSVLVCPKDKSRTKASNWGEFTKSSQLSYFLCFEAEETKGQTVLSGDRNLNTNEATATGFVLLTGSEKLSWATGIHAGYGNIGMADGSVQQVTTPNLNTRFQATFLSTTQAAVRLVIPK